MQRMRMLLRTLSVVSFFSMATLALSLPAHAGGVHASIGLPLPVPVFVAPVPVLVSPPLPVVYPAPVVVGPGYYGYVGYRPGYWRHHHHHRGYYGYHHGYWRHPHRHPHRWHRW